MAASRSSGLGPAAALLCTSFLGVAQRVGQATKGARGRGTVGGAAHGALWVCIGYETSASLSAVPSYRFHQGRARTSKQVEVSRSGFEWDKLKHLNIRNSGDMHSVPPFLTLESKRSLAILLAHGCPLLSASCLCTSPPTASEQHLSHAALAVRSRHQRAAAYYKHTAARGCRRLSLVAAGERACCVHATML